MWWSSATTGFSDSFGSRSLGRPKCASRMTLPPLPAISVMVGTTRSMRVASATFPFSIGTLRSTRTSTRLPERFAESRVLNAIRQLICHGRLVPAIHVLNPASKTWMPGTRPGMTPERFELDQLPHRHSRIGHSVREAPFVVVPRHHAHQRAVHHLGLIHVERGGVRIVVEVDRDIRIVGVPENALELLLGRTFHRIVDLVLGGLLLGDDLEIDDGDIRRRHADRDAVELALELRQHET